MSESGGDGCLSGVKIKTRTILVPARYLYGSTFSAFTDAGTCSDQQSGGDGSGGAADPDDCCGIWVASDTSGYLGAERFVQFHDVEASTCSPGVSWEVVRDDENSPIEITAQVELPDLAEILEGVNVVDVLNAGGECAWAATVGLTNPDDDYSVVWGMQAGPPEWTNNPEVFSATVRTTLVVGVSEEIEGVLQFETDEHEFIGQFALSDDQIGDWKIRWPRAFEPTAYQFLAALNPDPFVGGADIITDWVGLCAYSTGTDDPLPSIVASSCDWRAINFLPSSFVLYEDDDPNGDGPDMDGEVDQIPHLRTKGRTGDLVAQIISVDEDGDPCISDVYYGHVNGLWQVSGGGGPNAELTEAIFGDVGCGSTAQSGSGSGSDLTPIPNPGYIDFVDCVEVTYEGQVRVRKKRLLIPPWMKLFDLGCEIVDDCGCDEGSGSGSGGATVESECCEEGPVPETLTATLEVIATHCDVETGDEITLVHAGDGSWPAESEFFDGEPGLCRGFISVLICSEGSWTFAGVSPEGGGTCHPTFDMTFRVTVNAGNDYRVRITG